MSIQWTGAANRHIDTASGNFAKGSSAAGWAGWFRLDQRAGANADGTVFWGYDSGQKQMRMRMFLSGGDTITYPTMYNAGATARQGSNNPTPDGWHHYAVTYTGTKWVAYYDGTPTDITTETSTVQDAACALWLGQVGTNLDWDVTVYNLAIWNDSALSDADVLALYNMTDTPATLTNQADHYWLFDSTTGTAVASTGNLLDLIGSADFSTITGDAPVYVSDAPVAPTPSVFVDSIETDPSGKLLLIRTVDSEGAAVRPADYRATSSATITVELNGGGDTSVTDLLFPEAASGPFKGFVARIPEAARPSNAGDVLTVTCDQALVTENGETSNFLEALADEPVTNRFGADPWEDGTTLGNRSAMKLGEGMEAFVSYNRNLYFCNLAKQILEWTNAAGTRLASGSNGLPTEYDTGHCYASIMQGYSTYVLPVPVGSYRLLWQGGGDASCTLIDSSGNGLVTNDGGDDIGSWHYIDYTIADGAIYLRIDVTGGGAPDLTDLRLIPAAYRAANGYDTVQEFTNEIISDLRGRDTIRWIHLLGIFGAAAAVADDLADDDAICPAAAPLTYSATIDTIEEYAGSAFDGLTEYTNIQINCTAAHGLSDGQVVQMPSDLGTAFWSVGGASMSSARYAIAVVDSDSFAIYTQISGTLDTGYSGAGVVGVKQTRPIMSLEAICRLCNAVGANLWLNIPHCASDALVTAMATAVDGALNSGRTIYIEYTNEAWNYGSGYEGSVYMTVIKNAEALDNAQEGYALRAAEVHALCAAVFDASVRPYKRVFGSQAGNIGVGTNISDYITAETLPIECMCVGGYFTNGYLNTADADVDPQSVLTSMDVDEVVATHVWGTEDPTTYLISNKTIADGLGAELLVYEGGQHDQDFNGDNDFDSLLRQCQDHPRMGRAYLEMLKAARDAGVTLFVNFQNAGHWPEGNYWGARHWVGQATGRGDGSDGKADNTADSTDYTNHVSAKAWALAKWTATHKKIRNRTRFPRR